MNGLGPVAVFSTAEVAAELRLSRDHLSKIIAALTQAGVVVTQWGSGGGAQLAQPAEPITLGEVVRVSEAG